MRFFLYARLSDKNPHLAGSYSRKTVKKEELRRLTSREHSGRVNLGAAVFVETGVCDGKKHHDDGATEELRKQFFQDCPEAVPTGRVWWIPLNKESGDAVVIPTADGNYELCTLD